jgi:AraC-like DNA-binding protein
MTTTHALANSPKTFLDRDLWMCALLASGLPHVVICVGMRIGLHLRVKTGRCDPGYDKLAGELGMSKRSIYRMVAMLEHTKWLSVIRSGHHRENQFVLLRGDKALSPLRGDKALSPQDTSEVTDSNVRGDRISTSEVTPAVTEKEGTKRTTKRTAEESDSRAPLFASLGDSLADPPQTPSQAGLAEAAERSRRGRKKESAAKPQARISPAEVADGFERFYGAYPRKVAKAAALKAFAKAVENGIAAETLIAGAQRYAVERKDQDPKYTKHPATWLNGGCWEDELPGAPVIDEAGNVVAVEQPPPQEGRRLTPLEMALAMDGGW